MPRRRAVLGAVGGIAGTALVGFSVATGRRTNDGTGPVDETDGADVDEVGPALEYVRNVEEVRGHLASSANLLEQGRRDDAALHAGHPTDYFGPILVPLRDEDPELATRLRAALETPGDRVESLSASEYRTYLADELFPMLDSAVETVVPGDVRSRTSFDVRVMNALAGRIAEEYDAAVPSAGTVDLVGEYWDGRGFLVRIENRYATVESALDGAGSETLSGLRTAIEDVAAAGDVLEGTLRFRIETAAAADLPSATVEGRADALTYVKSVEEVRGHLSASATLAAVGDDDAALHAGHPGDYVTTILPPVQASNPELATRLLDRLLAAGDRVESTSASDYEQFVTEKVMGPLAEAVSVAVPEEFTGSTSFDAAVFLALADRITEEYDAAVTEDEAIELYGEYWDARGFLNRLEERFGAFESDLDGDTASAVAAELERLREELETARPPWDVADSVDALHDALDDVAEA